MSAARRALPLAVSIGEPAGIGPDIILRAFERRRQDSLPPFVVFGDPALLAARALALDIAVTVAAVDGGEALPAFSRALPVCPLSRPMRAAPGTPDPADAPLVIEAIDAALASVERGGASALVTAPIMKSALYAAGFTHPGHTEYLAALAERAHGRPFTPVMMIAGPDLRTVPVTIHLPLAEVPGALTAGLIEETCRIVAHDLTARFGIARPRLAVSGLNPHAGESGTMGREEVEVIGPALERLRAEGLDIAGPLPADTMFHAAARARYDAAVCMYHDQALIPAKALAFEDGVNVTLGLPFVRTSPDHGTALGLAGTRAADPSSFIAALRMADAMSRTGPART